MGDGGPSSDREDDPNNRIDEAYEFFYETIRRGERGESEQSRRDAELSSSTPLTLYDLLKVVSITLEPEDNAQVVWRTLNARGLLCLLSTS